MKLGELFQFWTENHSRVHCRRWRDFESDWRLYLSPWTDRELETIRKRDVVELSARIGLNNGKGAANRAICLLSMLYSRAIEWEFWNGENPASKVRKFRLKPRDRFLQPNEIPIFLRAVKALRYSTTRDFFLMLLYTGQRRRNVAEMRWAEIDFQRKVWQIPDTKNGTAHALPLVDEAIELLARRSIKAHPIWVFPRQDATGPIWNVSTAWAKILAVTGLTGLRIHDLRRTHASWQAATGASLPIIGRTLNHKDASSTQIYARLYLEPVREAMEKAVDAMKAAS